ncbi:hypothetical protein A9W98_20575 [Mycobacterium gordonae]|uniref:Long-chain-alcohol oxidase n=1 Tax=Mycobacterium gordonae TaxID=1778 RepID=A0A1A6BG64_MYCGO|nr:hypothetical protein A9W98_20575 [Mycobacterium gordonae]
MHSIFRAFASGAQPVSGDGDAVAAQNFVDWVTRNRTAAGYPEFEALQRRITEAGLNHHEGILLSWLRSRDAGRRNLGQSLKTVALLAHLAVTESARTWAASGYAAPVAGPASAAGWCTHVRIQQETTVGCDVVIAGSGSAAGIAAAVLAASGLDVIVLAAADFTTSGAGAETWQAVANRFAPIPRSELGTVALLGGACRHGEQVVNHTAAFRTPDSIRTEWAGYGANQFADDEYDDALNAVCGRLGATTEPTVIAVTGNPMVRGLAELGWDAAAIPRSVAGCGLGSVTGSCVTGCPLGARQPAATTWLHDAVAYGARIVLGANVDEVLIRHGKAVGVTATSVEGHALTVRADAVLIADAAVPTAALLLRSGLSNPNIGRHLRLHPHLMVFAEYEDDLESWDQLSMPYSAEHSDLDGNGYGVRYVGQPLSPWMLAYGPWTGAADFAHDRSRLHSTSTILVVLRDHGDGRVTVGPGGHPRVHYRVSGMDRAHLQAGLAGALRIAVAGGAIRVWPQHTQRVEYRPDAESLDDYLRWRTDTSWSPGHLSCYTTHQLGTARMGGSPVSSVTDPDGATWEVKNLVVADGSCLPTATGVNPAISIDAVAYMNARRLAAALR